MTSRGKTLNVLILWLAFQGQVLLFGFTGRAALLLALAGLYSLALLVKWGADVAEARLDRKIRELDRQLDRAEGQAT